MTRFFARWRVYATSDGWNVTLDKLTSGKPFISHGALNVDSNWAYFIKTKAYWKIYVNFTSSELLNWLENLLILLAVKQTSL